MAYASAAASILNKLLMPGCYLPLHIGRIFDKKNSDFSPAKYALTPAECNQFSVILRQEINAVEARVNQLFPVQRSFRLIGIWTITGLSIYVGEFLFKNSISLSGILP